MMQIPGATTAFSAADIMPYIDMTATLDWTMPEADTITILEKRFGWKRASSRRFVDVNSMPCFIWGSEYDTIAIRMVHTRWDIDASGLEQLKASRMADIAAAISSYTATTPGRAQRKRRLDYYFNLSDGRRIWLEADVVEILSPGLARAERFAEENPDKFASYGDDGEYA